MEACLYQNAALLYLKKQTNTTNPKVLAPYHLTGKNIVLCIHLEGFNVIRTNMPGREKGHLPNYYPC